MAWFSRKKEGITTSTEDKKETPEGLWHKCPSCKKITLSNEHAATQYVCTECQYHEKIGSAEYFEILFDENSYKELFSSLSPADPLKFEDTKPYAKRMVDSQRKTGLKDAMRSAEGTIEGQPVVIACMDFSFIGGSMGAVVGEKISRSISHCIDNNLPLII